MRRYFLITLLHESSVVNSECGKILLRKSFICFKDYLISISCSISPCNLIMFYNETSHFVTSWKKFLSYIYVKKGDSKCKNIFERCQLILCS